MQSKDIVMQVSEETSEVMKEIMEESDARFNEVVEAIEKSIKKVESLYAEFTGYAGNSNKQLTSNQAELIEKVATVLNAIKVFRKDVGEQTVQSNEKVDRLIVSMADIPQLIQTVSNSITESADARSEFEATLLEVVKGLAQNLVELQKLHSGVMDKLNADDSQEKLVSALNKLADIEKEILQTKDGVGNVADSLRNCSTLIEQLLSSVKGLQENDEKILNVGGENTKKADELGKQTEETSKLLFEKMGDILTCLDTLSHSVQAISEKQNELFEKQAELDKDVKYLKLPFFKRWFTKG